MITKIKSSNRNPANSTKIEKVRRNGITSIVLHCPKPIITHTSGNGLWSCDKRKIEITKIELKLSVDWTTDDDIDELSAKSRVYVYMNVFFSSSDWKASKHGLIYTDAKWMREFNAGIKTAFPTLFGNMKFDYTEQGMQGNNYVSIEATTCLRGKKKIEEYFEKVRNFALCQALDRDSAKNGKMPKKSSK